MTDARSKAPLTVMVYNPSRLKKEDLIRGFVARQALLDRLLDDLRREKPGSPPQHQLILGQRGQGKTTLLLRLAYAVEDTPELSASYLPVVFPEEQWNVASLAKFWLNCVDALSDALDHAGRHDDSQRLDERVAALPQAADRLTDAALNLLLEEADFLGRRLLLLIDNFDLVLERLGKDEEWQFRKVISNEHRLHFVGASSRAIETFYEYDRAFYDFFQVVELKGLDEQEALATLTHLAKESNSTEVLKLSKDQPGRIKTLWTLTGGNPRTIVVLSRILEREAGGDVLRDIELLLDEYTELYKARLADFAPQAQQVVDALAINWDPATAADLAERLAPMPTNVVSAQLKRLENLGVAEQTPWFGEKKTAYQLSERFFNIWYLMRTSRRVRRRLLWLVKFLQVWFDSEELSVRARDLLDRNPEAMGREHFGDLALVYSQTVADPHLRRSLEFAGLSAILDDSVRHLFDFSELPPEMADKKERMDRLKQLKEATLRCRIDWTGIDQVEFWLLLCGSPLYSVQEKARMVEQLPSLSADDLQKLYLKLKTFKARLTEYNPPKNNTVARLYEALSCGEIDSASDYQSALAVAKRSNLPWLPFVAIRALFDTHISRELIADGATEIAETALRALTEETGFEALAWGHLGILLSDLKRYGESEKAFHRAIEMDPKVASFWNWLGRLHSQYMGRYDEAEKDYRRAIELDSEYAGAWSNLGNLLASDQKRFEEAEKACRRAIAIDPMYTFAWSNLGIVLTEHTKRYAEAEKAFRRAIELNPQFAWAWANLGNLLANHTERYDEAEMAYRQAIEIDPQFAWAWGDLGDLFATHVKQYNEAEKAFRRAVEIDPQYVWAWGELGYLLASCLNQYDEAEKAYRRAVEIDPQYGWAWNSLGILLHDHLKRFDEAENAYGRAIEIDSEDDAAWNNLGNLLAVHLKRYDEAELAFRKSIELDPNTTISWRNLAILLDGKPGRELDFAEASLRVCELSPEKLWESFRLTQACGSLAAMQSPPPAAMKLVQRAAELLPEESEIQFALGSLLTNAGKWPEASQLLEKLAEETMDSASIEFFRAILKSGHLDDALAILERAGANEHSRPLYEALRAVRAGTPDYLRTVAPEVRTTALDILKELKPDLLPK